MNDQHEEPHDTNNSYTIQIASYEGMCPKKDCKSRKVTFKYYENEEEHDLPLFQCKDCNVSFICTKYENKCPRETCKSTNVTFKYFNNNKKNQPKVPMQEL
jgi:hypothetical protein